MFDPTFKNADGTSGAVFVDPDKGLSVPLHLLELSLNYPQDSGIIYQSDELIISVIWMPNDAMDVLTRIFVFNFPLEQYYSFVTWKDLAAVVRESRSAMPKKVVTQNNLKEILDLYHNYGWGDSDANI